MTEKELKRTFRILYYQINKLNFFVYPICSILWFCFFLLSDDFAYSISCFMLSILFFSIFTIICLMPLFSDYLYPQKTIFELLFYQEKYFKIDENFIEIYYEDGSHLKINLKNYTKATKEDSYFFLHTKNFYGSVIGGYGQFECIPIRAFNSEDEVKAFTAILNQKGLLK